MGSQTVIGIGGAGSRLAAMAAPDDHIAISHRMADLEGAAKSVCISSGGAANPSVGLVRSGVAQAAGQIAEAISGASSAVIIANLSGRAGAAIAPPVLRICKEEGCSAAAIVIMPFGFEKSRIFDAGVSFRRVKEDAGCTAIIDNDAMLKSNPALTRKECFDIADSAILHVLNTLEPGPPRLVSVGRAGDAEESLRDAVKMLYGSSPSGAAQSLVHVLGDSIPVGLYEAASYLAGSASGGAEQDVAAGPADERAGTVMVSAASTSKFDAYDPLSFVPASDTLDWQEPECSIDCSYEEQMYQME